MSHGDKIEQMPPDFTALAYTENSPYAVIGHSGINENGGKIYGLQFHPEVAHTPEGRTILRNFVYKVCGCQGNWTMGNFVSESMARIKEQVGGGRVINALSGGVDSSVVATLIHRAIGDQLTCIFVNNGLLRREEVERTLKVFKTNLGMNIIYVDASDRFLDRLKGVTDPEQKRKIIGEEFIRVFEEEAARIGKVDFLAQGTLYPDVIESISSVSTASAKIKSHHNVGGLPARMTLKLLEPLRFLFKDEVRQVGAELGLPEEMVWRQPFPGPGLAIRCIGEVTREKLEILRGADFILMNEIKKAKLLPPALAELLRADGRALGGRHGRFPHLRLPGGGARRDQRGRHDGRLGPPALRPPGAHLQPHRQRGGRRQPRRLRYHLQAPSTIEWE